MEASQGEGALERLRRALDTAKIAALLINPGPQPSAQSLKGLITMAQNMGVAVLVASEPALARSLGADGVHVAWSRAGAKTFAEVRKALPPPLIVGADAGRSRHDAMEIGEGGADYVAFGIPPHVEDREKANARRLELVQWWAEIFEVPVVAFDVETPAEAANLLEAGADFIAVTMPQDVPAAGIPDWIRPFAKLVPAPRIPA
jgi:thiamine-phosphate pyrophosphorylase